MIMTKCEGELRKAGNKLNKIQKIYDKKISTICPEWMGFGNKCGKRVTIEMEVTAVGKFYNYNYFELLISVEILINTWL